MFLLDASDAPTHPDLVAIRYSALVRDWFDRDRDRLFDVTW
jgi:hypothetical protein